VFGTEFVELVNSGIVYGSPGKNGEIPEKIRLILAIHRPEFSAFYWAKKSSTAFEKYIVRTALEPTEREGRKVIMPRENSGHQPTVGVPRDIPSSHKDIRSLHKVIPDATSDNLGWAGLQVVRYRDLATNEIHMPALSQHLLMLHTKPPAQVNFRYEGGTRDIPAPLGSITFIPVGSAVECRWRGAKDAIHMYLDPKLISRIATTSFELDLSRTAIPPFDALSAPELRATMLAVDAELTASGAGGPLMIESLGNVLAVHLIRRIFGLRRLTSRTHGALPRRKLATVIDYIMANLDGRPTLEQMAALVGIGPDHFLRQFKAATGLPPHQFVITRRVERAQQLLCGQRGVSLAEVAISAGFSDQSQFCFHFKRIVGVTPGQFQASKIA
jgi:AraC family transcriptional regulator